MAGNAIQFNLGFNLGPLQTGARKAQAMVARTVSRLNAIGASAGKEIAKISKGLGIGLAAGTAAIGVGVKNVLDLGGALSDVSARTGITAGNVLVLQQAFKNSGMEAGDVAGTINKMQKALAGVNEDGEDTSGVFKGLGLDLQQLRGLSPDKQFALIGQAINGIQDPAAKAAAAMKVFGKSGAQLLPLFSDPQAFSGAAKELGSQIDILNGKAGVFDTIGDKLGNMVPAKLQGLFVGLTESLATPMMQMLNAIEGFDFARIGAQIGEGIKAAVNWALRMWDIIKRVADTLSAGFFEGQAILMDAVNALVSGVDYAANILQGAFGKAMEFSTSIIATLAEGFSNVTSLLSAGLEAVIQSVMEQIGQIDGVGKMMGLQGFKAQSMQEIADRNKRNQPETAVDAFAKSMRSSADGWGKFAGEKFAGAADENKPDFLDTTEVRKRAEEFAARAMEPRKVFQFAKGITPAAPVSPAVVQQVTEAAMVPGINTTRGAFANTRTSLGGAYGQIRRGDAARRRRTEEAARKEAELAKNKTPEGTNERLDKMIKGFGFK